MAEIRDLGVAATVERRVLPGRRPGQVSVVFDPARLRFGRRSRRAGRRTLDRSLLLHAGGGGKWRGERAFELDFASYRLRRSRGEPVEHLPIGWSPGWSAPPGAEREIDLAVFGATHDHHFRLLARAADELSRRRVHVAVSDDPLALERGEDGQEAAARRAVLARSKVRRRPRGPRHGPRLDGLRAAEAICAGAALVREGSRPLDPLQPGRDYLVGGEDAISAALDLLAAPDRVAGAAVLGDRHAPRGAVAIGGGEADRRRRGASGRGATSGAGARKPEPASARRTASGDHRSRRSRRPPAVEAGPSRPDRARARARTALAAARRAAGGALGRALEPGGGDGRAAGLGAGDPVQLRARDRRRVGLGRRLGVRLARAGGGRRRLARRLAGPGARVDRRPSRSRRPPRRPSGQPRPAQRSQHRTGVRARRARLRPRRRQPGAPPRPGPPRPRRSSPIPTPRSPTGSRRVSTRRATRSG